MASDSAKSHWWNDPAKRAVAGAVLAAVPVALVNTVAFIGQFAYLNSNVPWPVIARVLIAVTVESIAIYLAWHAHLAKMANDTAMRLVLGAYGVALLIATVNYSHFARDWHPTPLAVIMGLASLISPFLWGVHTKRASRDKMMAMDPPLIEQHAVRLGGTRWTWHPFRSTRATSWAAWHGENDPKVVLAHFAPRYGTADVPAAPRKRAVPSEALQPVPAAQDVPAIAPPPVPEQTVPAPIPGTTLNQASDGTEVNGVPVPAVHQAGAELSAEPSVSGHSGIPENVRREAELALMGMTREQVEALSEREISRDLLHVKRSRVAGQLKKARLAMEPLLMEAPPIEMTGGMIAPMRGGGRVG